MPRKRWILFGYFLSGASSLIAEVIWVRLLKLTLGNTVYASSIVVSVFLGGLALGALLIGKRVDRSPSPLRLYMILELSVAVLITISPFAIGWGDGLYRHFYQSLNPSAGILLLAQVLVSGLIILVPTTAMGATFPALGVVVARMASDQNAGRPIGGLYALNTLGAATGCFLAGFVLIRTIGMNATLGVSVALSVSAAFFVWLSTTRSAPGVPLEGEASAEPSSSPTSPPWHAPLLVASFLGGFASVAYEIFWMRGLVIFVQARTYVFSAVLTVYLLGLVIGAWIASRLARARTSTAAPAVVLILLGASGFAYVPLLATSPGLHAGIWFPWAESMELKAGLPFETTYPLIISFVFFLLPSVLIGMSFPIVLAAWQAQAASVGRSTGGVYAVGTFGSVVGGLAAGFLLIPWLGVQGGMTATGAVIALVGIVMLAFCPGRWKAVSGAALISTIVIMLIVPGDLFERYLVARLKSHYNAVEVLHVKEGITTTATIHTQNQTLWTVPLSANKLVQRSVPTKAPTRHIAVSGLHVASDEPGQSSWQKFHGHSAMLLHGNAKRAICVGFGSGESLACMARHKPEVLECVEISPEVVEASIEFFPHINLGKDQDKHAKIIFADGRNYLHLTDKTYDVIMSDPINPTTGENGSLYSLEFFRSAREHLVPRGLFIFWLPLHLPRNVLESILATAMKAYPHVTMWTVPIAGGTFVQIVCSAEQQRYRILAIDRTMLTTPAVRSSLTCIGIPDSAALLAHYKGDEKDIRPLLQDPVVNTDNRPLVEFSTQRAMFKITAPFILELMRCARPDSVLDHVDWGIADESARQSWIARQNAFRKRVVP